MTFQSLKKSTLTLALTASLTLVAAPISATTEERAAEGRERVTFVSSVFETIQSVWGDTLEKLEGLVDRLGEKESETPKAPSKALAHPDPLGND